MVASGTLNKVLNATTNPTKPNTSENSMGAKVIFTPSKWNGGNAGSSERDHKGIELFFPHDLSTSYKMDWEGKEFKTTGEMGAALGRAAGGVWKRGVEIGKGLASTFGYEVEPGISGSPEDLQALKQGTTENPNIINLFKKIDCRSISFSWKYSPKSEEDWKSFKKKTDALKRYAHPSMGDSKRYLEFPSIWSIEFYGPNAKPTNEYFKIKTCVITSIDLKYGTGSNLSVFSNGAPSMTTLNLSIQELRPLTREDFMATGGMPNA